MGELGHERAVAVRASVGALRLHRRFHILAHRRMRPDEIGGREFCLDWLVERKGRVVDDVPAASPLRRTTAWRFDGSDGGNQRRLHYGYGAGLSELFANCMEAASVLRTADAEFAAKL